MKIVTFSHDSNKNSTRRSVEAAAEFGHETWGADALRGCMSITSHRAGSRYPGGTDSHDHRQGCGRSGDPVHRDKRRSAQNPASEAGVNE